MPSPRIGSALLLRDSENRLLLGKRNKHPYRGYWVLPGGQIRPFESIAAAAKRECLEEAGLDILVEDQFRTYEIIKPPEHRIIVFSWATVLGGDLRASSDISDARFCSYETIPLLLLTPFTEQVLCDAFGHKVVFGVDPSELMRPH